MPVRTLFDYLEGGDTLEDFLIGFPTVPRTLALEALEEAKHLLLAGSRTNVMHLTATVVDPEGNFDLTKYCSGILHP